MKTSLLDFVIIFGLGFSFVAAGFAAGIGVRLELTRGSGGVEATASNRFAGFTFYSKTIGPVTGTVSRVASTNKLSETMAERNRRQRQKSVDLVAEDNRRLGWGREQDQGKLDDFLRGEETSMVLEDNPPLWRGALSWAGIVLGVLFWVGAAKKPSPGAVQHIGPTGARGRLP